VLTRGFDASRREIFDAFTKPELVRAMVAGTTGLVDAGLRDRFESRRCLSIRMASHQRQGNGRWAVSTARLPRNSVSFCTELYDDAWYPGEALTTTYSSRSDAAQPL